MGNPEASRNEGWWTVKVRDIMTPRVVAFRPGDTVESAARRLAQSHISGAPVVERGEVVGVVSEADIISAFLPAPSRGGGPVSILEVMKVLGKALPHRSRQASTVRDLMSHLVVLVSPDEDAARAADIMRRRGVNRLPVVDGDDKLLGIVTRADLVRSIALHGSALR